MEKSNMATGVVPEVLEPMRKRRRSFASLDKVRIREISQRGWDMNECARINSFQRRHEPLGRKQEWR